MVDTESILYKIGRAVKTAGETGGKPKEYYSEFIFTNDVLTAIDTWTDSTKTEKISTRTFTYTNGSVTQIIETDGSGEITSIKSIIYDGNGNLSSVLSQGSGSLTPPSGISVTTSPQFAPSGISVTTSNLSGPTGISVATQPQVGPTSVGVTLPPQVSPTGISVSTVTVSQSPTIAFDGNTYTLGDDSSTLNISGSWLAEQVTRQDDSGEDLITFDSGAPWDSANGPELTVSQIHPTANYVAVDITEGSQQITRRTNAIFSNGVIQVKPFATIGNAHTSNLISGSTTRSKLVLRLTWRTSVNATLDTKYYKIGFKNLAPYQSFTWSTSSLNTFTPSGFGGQNIPLQGTYAYVANAFAGAPGYSNTSNSSYGSILLDTVTNKWGYYDMYGNGLSGSPDILLTNSDDITDLTTSRSNMADSISNVN
jgi:hypothetical protein